MEEEIPEEYRKVLGYTIRERLNTVIHDIVNNSTGQPDIIYLTVWKNHPGTADFLFEHVLQKSTGEDGRTAGN